MTIALKQRVPDFVTIDDDPSRATIETAADLASIPWIAQWSKAADFHQFSQSRDGSHTLLIAEQDGGQKQWVVAFADVPIPGLPEWIPPERKP